ncbi:MAG: hypothetical protein KKH29_06000 [Candidatus Omnitrophica bacterium]|nr:hypothetical protein [Candidatus Omnitrophota bacterium]MCG2706418.1 hypothetical protein [Candidatus Omnitrophota bacterium]
MILRQRNIIGIDIDEDVIAACELSKKSGGVYLNNYKIVSHLKQLSEGVALKNRSVVISLPSQLLLFRTFVVGSGTSQARDQKKAILSFLLRQNLPLELDDCFWNTFKLNGYLNLVAAKKEVVEKYLGQLKEQGFNVAAVLPSFLALYNLLVYNYGYKENFSLLNMRYASSDLLIFEGKQIWMYPLPKGRQHLKDNPENQVMFAQELYRAFNTYYLQNPTRIPKANNYLYLGGGDYSESLISHLKKEFVGYEVLTLEPLKRIIPLNKPSAYNSQMMALSLGLGLTFLGVPGATGANLIKEKVRKELISAGLDSLQKISTYAGVAVIVFLFLLNIKLLIDLKNRHSVFRMSQFQVSALLPEVKILKEEQERLEKLRGFLRQKLNQQNLYLKALGVISESKSPFIEIKELEAQAKEGKVEISLSGEAPNYEEINRLLIELKKNRNLKEVKVVASAFTGIDQGLRAIDFKLRFEIE